ncbi:proton-conducting transporter membrane subunit [Nonomuraea sp. NPDC046570]|uniref:proton-conducting transporter transmembrane domain-containing protein n=1 Tax=Nonomuraea sp. NPDC046570 TaxID=3155255 RepID=UPI0033D6AB8B
MVVAAGTDSLTGYQGLARRHPGLAASLAVCLLGLVGTPTAVFVGKLLVFAAAWDGGFAWLAVVAVLNTVASLFYYLRWLRPLFATGEGVQAAPGPVAIACVAAALSLLLGIASGLVLTFT